MSTRQESILITPPSFGTGEEQPEEFTGYRCGYCNGEAGFWGYDDNYDWTKSKCPKCEGLGMVKAVVRIEWVPDGNGSIK